MGSATRDGGGALHSFDGWLYWAIRNQSGSGLEVWRTQNGTNWTQIGFGGFGDANNAFMNYDQAVTVFNDGLYFATRNWANGGEIWQFQDRNIFLPLLKR
jgi:hypothetical protein